MAHVLVLKNINKSYEQQGQMSQVFVDMSYEFSQKHSYAIVGASGSGKSTCLHLLGGILQPTAGNVFFNQEQLNLFSQYRYAQFFAQNMSFIFQKPMLMAELSVLENVMFKAILQGKINDKDYQRARDLLAQVGLVDKADAYPNMLSGGQQQRVALLRAIFIVPDFLLADEPTGNLDEQTGNQIIDLLLSYKKEYGMGLIMSTHNHEVAKKMDRVIQVYNQKLIDIGL
ncbi:MAG: ABC transporter ATP-binding protein [Candidatus Chromulinivorax sp.]